MIILSQKFGRGCNTNHLPPPHVQNRVKYQVSIHLIHIPSDYSTLRNHIEYSQWVSCNTPIDLFFRWRTFPVLETTNQNTFILALAILLLFHLYIYLSITNQQRIADHNEKGSHGGCLFQLFLISLQDFNFSSIWTFQ